MIPYSNIFESLFKKTATDPGNRQMLQQIVEEHPYFTAAQFFLLTQTEKQADDYKEQAARTALLFNNPLWLQWQLKYGDHPVSSLPRETAPAVEIFQPAPEPETIQEPVPVPEAIVETSMPEEDATTQPEEENTGATEIDNSPAIEPEEKVVLNEREEQIIAEARDQQGSVEEPLFEPMHLVDYFASQGIRLSEESQNSDKLGKQLRSFTEWLKTMKKVHTTGKLPDTTEQAEKLVQHLAEKSNVGKEVLTEAMAEVLVKQGKPDKAVELYQKLSLLDPSKNAYFAAKIAGLGG